MSTAASGASNLGPTNEDLLATVEERVDAYRDENGLAADTLVPVDAVTASGSGLDPHISVANARLQAPRVAEARGLSTSTTCSTWSTTTPSSRLLGFLGEQGVNVLELNLALDEVVGVTARGAWGTPGCGAARCASTSAPPPASARPSPCSTRAGAGASGAPTWSSASSRPTAGPTPPSRSATSRSCPAARRVPGHRASRRWTSTPCWPAGPRSRWSTSWPTPTSPARRHAKRWQDVEELLDAGIDVISTVNIQHLESLNDVVERITGVRQRETIPDAIVRAADQIELVDMTPEALRRRMAHGNIYAAEKIDAALANYFRPGNLAALRELALLWVADRVDDALEDYRERHGITEPWETRERVVVAVTGAPGADAPHPAGRPHRPARPHGELLGVHVRTDDGLAGDDDGRVDEQRRLLEELGGTYHEIAGQRRRRRPGRLRPGRERHPARARRQPAVAGSPSWSGARSSTGSCGCRARSTSTSSRTDRRRRGRRRAAPCPAVRRHPAALPPRRRAAGLGAGGARACPLLTAVLVPMRDDVEPAERPAALPAARGRRGHGRRAGPGRGRRGRRVPGGQLVLHPAPPHLDDRRGREPAGPRRLPGRWPVVVSALVAAAARRTAEATRAAAEAETLAGLAGTVAERRPAARCSSTTCAHAFGLARRGAAARKVDGDGWQVEAVGRRRRPRRPPRPTRSRPLGGDLVLAVRGSDLAAEDRRVLNAFVAQLAAAIDRRRVGAQAARAAALAEANELRTRPAPGGVARPAHPAGRHQGVGQQPAPARHRLVATRTATSSSPPSRTRPTGSPRWWRTCST